MPVIAWVCKSSLSVAVRAPRPRPGFSEAEFAGRYDLVLHLATTAHGLEAVYEAQKANNAARTETAAEARELDDRVLACWSPLHPEVVRLGNDYAAGFEGKLRAVVDAVEHGLAAAAAAARQG